MKGKALIAIRLQKPRQSFNFKQNPFGIIRGRSEELRSASPRERRLENKIYLKSVTPNIPLIHRPESQLETSQSLLNESYPELKEYSQKRARHTPNKLSEPVKFENFVEENQTKFVEYCCKMETGKLSELDVELFPEELREKNVYITECRPTRLISSSFAGQMAYKLEKKKKHKKRRVNTSLLSSMLESFYEKKATINYENIKENKYMPFINSHEPSINLDKDKFHKRKSVSLAINSSQRRDKIRILTRSLLPDM
ncbi:unnamed protein product [Blepharisma stoltei]|uniref:Uncharacterized protein n=1 Tax=Blepharisma stoltei TaxID=1481888 RepID=A0AAU9I885_9CILI|nr:unnamed protein product [Blepharisma stoltei]